MSRYQLYFLKILGGAKLGLGGAKYPARPPLNAALQTIKAMKNDDDNSKRATPMNCLVEFC